MQGALHHGSRKPVSNLPRTKITVRTTKPTTGAAGSATQIPLVGTVSMWYRFGRSTGWLARFVIFSKC
jgi:hypothetical protein